MSEDFRLRSIAIPAYAPSTLAAIGYGAMLPMIALRALDLGASVSLAAFMVGLMSLGSIGASVPLGMLIARFGEKVVLIGASSLMGLMALVVATVDVLAVMAVATLIMGAGWAGFLNARLGYMVNVLPSTQRARGMSYLGGTLRVGVLVGPLVGAAIIELSSLRWVFVFAAAMAFASALVSLRYVPRDKPGKPTEGPAAMLGILREHRRTLMTLGGVVLVMGAARSVRGAIIPLWADHIGVSASTTSLLMGAASAADLAMLGLAGWVSERYGRTYVVVPVAATAALGCFLMPLTGDAWSLLAINLIIAVGNGLGAGIVMTLGGDTSPTRGQPQYLALWRLTNDLGLSGLPLLIAGLAVVLPLAGVSLVLGACGVAGTAWAGYWTAALDRHRRTESG